MSSCWRRQRCLGCRWRWTACCTAGAHRWDVHQHGSVASTVHGRRAPVIHGSKCLSHRRSLVRQNSWAVYSQSPRGHIASDSVIWWRQIRSIRHQNWRHCCTPVDLLLTLHKTVNHACIWLHSTCRNWGIDDVAYATNFSMKHELTKSPPFYLRCGCLGLRHNIRHVITRSREYFWLAACCNWDLNKWKRI